MKRAVTYLNFDGNCRAAMTFYAKCLQAQEPTFMPFSVAPSEMADAAKAAPDRIMHVEIVSGPVTLMASDTMPGMPFRQGNNFAISIDCESEQELQRLFASLGEGGSVIMPVSDVFWGGRFGMLTDRFGIGWMFSFHEPGQHS